MTKEDKKAVIIIIGNEVLSGKTEEKNAAYLTRALRSLGVLVQRAVVIQDEVAVIAEEIRTSLMQFDLIFTCGGIGPTHDDVTMEGIAQGVGKPLVQHPVLIDIIQKAYAPEFNAVQSRLAIVPDGTKLIFSDGLRFPVLLFDKIYIFPGIPELVVKKFEAIKERFREAPFFLTKIYLAEKEYIVAEKLRETLKHYPALQLGSYPKLHHPEYKLLLTLESKDKPYLNTALKFLVKLIPKESIVKIEEAPV